MTTSEALEKAINALHGEAMNFTSLAFSYTMRVANADALHRMANENFDAIKTLKDLKDKGDQDA